MLTTSGEDVFANTYHVLDKVKPTTPSRTATTAAATSPLTKKGGNVRFHRHRAVDEEPPPIQSYLPVAYAVPEPPRVESRATPSLPRVSTTASPVTPITATPTTAFSPRGADRLAIRVTSPRQIRPPTTPTSPSSYRSSVSLASIQTSGQQSIKRVKKAFADGGVYYEGAMNSQHQRDGYGRMKWGDGTTYAGHWKNDVREGFGRCTQNNGESYEGLWRKDQPHGRGTYRWPAAGGWFEGEFRHGAFEGRGVRKYRDGDIYDGMWKKGKREGRGTCRYADGSTYEGEWLHDLPHGKGKQRQANGDEYDGEFKNDLRDGVGTFRHAANGATYRGGWLNNKKQGVGITRWPDGDMDVDVYDSGVVSGDGVRWNHGQTKAWRLVDGKVKGKL